MIIPGLTTAISIFFLGFLQLIFPVRSEDDDWMEEAVPDVEAYIKVSPTPLQAERIGGSRSIIRKFFGVKTSSIEIPEDNNQFHNYEIVEQNQVEKLRKKKEQVFSNKLQYPLKTFDSYIEINDPYYSHQWYTKGKSAPAIDVERVWGEGIVGQGVRILVIDDSTDFSHPDLVDAHEKSLDRNYLTGTKDTSPTTVTQGHGTMVSGIVGARGGNGACGIGVAPGTKISCRVSIFSNSTLYTLLSSFENVQGVDVITNSWGFDNCDYEHGICLCIPETGIESSFSVLARSGNGTIIVFASGNEGLLDNDVNYSPLTRHPDVITVGAVGDDGRAAAYETKGKALFITGPSEGGKGDGSMAGIVAPTSVCMNTGEIRQSCTAKMNGTSAACPVVSGVIALIRQVNKALTPTDIRRILVASSVRLEEKDKTWLRNSAGVYHSLSYGFGFVSAGKAVDLAKKWNRCGHSSNTITRSRSLTLDPEESSRLTFSVSDKNNLIIESVRVLLGIRTTNLLGLTIKIISPSNEQRVLVAFEGGDRLIYPYDADSDKTGFLTWEFWGEQSVGTWTVVFDNSDNFKSVSFDDVRMEFIGQPSPFVIGSVIGESENSIRIPLQIVNRQEAKSVFGDSIRGDLYLYSEAYPDPAIAAKDVDLTTGSIILPWDDSFNSIFQMPPLHDSNSLRAVIVPKNKKPATYLTCNSFGTPLDYNKDNLPINDGFDISGKHLQIFSLVIPLFAIMSIFLFENIGM